MFNCEGCAQPTGPNIQPIRTTVSRRTKIYPFRPGANRPGPGANDHSDDPGGHGWEIKEEAALCAACAGIAIKAVAA